MHKMKTLQVQNIHRYFSRRFSVITAAKSPSYGGINIRNSIISSSESVSPSTISDEDNSLTWYSCGPTVYDAAHIGHARTYVCTDIIRRILTDIHHKDVNFAMGLTDIDDKIIDRAAQNGLKSWAETESMVRGLEDDFFKDLDSLNVRRPDAVLRVTEHVPEIIAYIEGILATGRSYITPDGVYFSVESCGKSYLQFKDSGKAVFADTDIPSEVVADSQSTFVLPPLGYKRDRRDFALWKTVKEGEPYWDSPWGPGRPGWHIECSAITNSYFGSRIDIHSGGIDLQFPHHTNEIAQCSAYNCTAPSEWVKFWIHTGHLYIEGRKMSKSLKNFISIQDYLQGSYSLSPAIDFRIFCLQYKYHSAIHFSQIRIDEAGSFRRKLENFFRLSNAVLLVAQPSHLRSKEVINNLQQSASGVSNIAQSKPTKESIALRTALSNCQCAVQIALANDFDTPEALKVISYLVGDAIAYASLLNRNASHSLEQTHSPQASSCIGNINLSPLQPSEPLIAVNYYLIDILGKLGVDFKAEQNLSSDIPSLLNESMSLREIAILESLLAFRSKVRTSSLSCIRNIKNHIKNDECSAAKKGIDPIEKISKIAVGDILTSCDTVRVTIREELGIHIDDYEGVSVWRQVKSPKVLNDVEKNIEPS